MNCTQSNLEKYIVKFSDNVKSLNDTLKERKQLFSPVESWVNEKILYVTDQGISFDSYLGYGVQTSKGEREMKGMKVLYPA